MRETAKHGYGRGNPSIRDLRIEVAHAAAGCRGIQTNVASSPYKRIGRQLVMRLSAGSNNDPHTRNLIMWKVIISRIHAVAKLIKEQG